ncbi:CoA pyrophosphatase [Orrella sp. 11846]|uniref:CoA pyrophosphatase n=1 Tax=Orrella sp. 11846 TaxID=3409913 RepID=UPI003B5AA006
MQTHESTAEHGIKKSKTLLPSFDPQAQSWEPAGSSYGAVPVERLAPDFIRDVLGGGVDFKTDLPREKSFSRQIVHQEPVPAAVLVPMVMRQEGLTVLLTQRTAHLQHHAGQVCFPGGRCEPDDSDAEATALRETLEETGLTYDHVDVLGRLPEYVTGTGYSITPVTALVRPDFSLAPDAGEVAEVFEVPLSFLTDPMNYRLHRARLPNGLQRQYYSVPWEQFFIWGATAAMLRGMYQILARAASSDNSRS